MADQDAIALLADAAAEYAEQHRAKYYLM